MEQIEDTSPFPSRGVVFVTDGRIAGRVTVVMPQELDRFTAWLPTRPPPPDWDERAAYLLRFGLLNLHGYQIRVYQWSDGQTLANLDDVEEGFYHERESRAMVRRLSRR